MTSIAAVLTPQTISLAQSEAAPIATAPTPSVNSNTFVFFAGFDGTWNSNPPVNGDTQNTAVPASPCL